MFPAYFGDGPWYESRVGIMHTADSRHHRRATVRNAGTVLSLRLLLSMESMAFALIVPRVMGPESYGRYALLIALSTWFLLASAFGLAQLASRQIPPLLLGRDRSALRTFLIDLVNIRLITAALSSALFLALTIVWLREIPAHLLWLVAGTLFLRSVSNLLYSFFLGLHEAGRWGLGPTLRAWLCLITIVPGFLLGGLTGAWIGLLVAELPCVALALTWLRPRFSSAFRREDVPTGLRAGLHRLRPQMGFGMAYFLSGLLTAGLRPAGMAMLRGGPDAVRQMGFYGIASDVFALLAATLAQLILSFTPFLTTLRERGKSLELRLWTDRLLRVGVAASVMGFAACALLAPGAAPVVFGRGFSPVGRCLLPLGLLLVPLVFEQVGYLLSLVFERPSAALVAAAVNLAVFCAVGGPLASRGGSFGICAAVLLAGVASAAVLFTGMRRQLRFPVRPSIAILLAATPIVPLALLPVSLPFSVVRFALFTAWFMPVLWKLRLLRAADWRTFRRALQRSSGAPPQAIAET